MTKYLITSALPYINGIKHLGNLVGSMLPADVYARYLRQRGHEVRYICATDEHGTPAELAASAAGVPVEEFCRLRHQAQKGVYDGFKLSFDHFGRSSSPENRELTQHIGHALSENGLLEERVTRQIYSRTDERFLPDRFVVGICPYCGYQAARGDQCESCTRLLDPTILIEPRSAVSGSTDLESRDSRHLFLLQSRLAEQVREWIESHENWPQLTTSIARKWLDEGLEDRGITRDLTWGVPVDRKGFEDKVYYVWFDAPIAYIAATKEAFDDWAAWWHNAEDVTHVQFMAKDNIPFHTIMFPAMLIGTGEPWKRADYIKGFNWLNYYGGKFSTSRGHGIFMDDALEILPADYWRYFLIAHAPESDDVTFTWELFAATVNNDLTNTLGNFVNRVLALGAKQFGEQVPTGDEPGDVEHRLGEQLAEQLRTYQDNLDRLQFRKAAQALLALWNTANGYVNRKAPWHDVIDKPRAAALTIRTAMNMVYLFGVISEPVIPDTARILQATFELEDSDPKRVRWPSADDIRSLDWIPAGCRFTLPPLLFRKLTEDDVATWRQRFC